jgi:hypothetical protein
VEKVENVIFRAMKLFTGDMWIGVDFSGKSFDFLENIDIHFLFTANQG